MLSYAWGGVAAGVGMRKRSGWQFKTLLLYWMGASACE